MVLFCSSKNPYGNKTTLGATATLVSFVLAKILMVTKLARFTASKPNSSVLAKILMVTKRILWARLTFVRSVLAKILMVTKLATTSVI